MESLNDGSNLHQCHQFQTRLLHLVLFQHVELLVMIAEFLRCLKRTNILT